MNLIKKTEMTIGPLPSKRRWTPSKNFKTFNILKDAERVPVGYQEIKCHMIFDIKFNDLRRKARYFAGGAFS